MTNRKKWRSKRRCLLLDSGTPWYGTRISWEKPTKEISCSCRQDQVCRGTPRGRYWSWLGSSKRRKMDTLVTWWPSLGSPEISYARQGRFTFVSDEPGWVQWTPKRNVEWDQNNGCKRRVRASSSCRASTSKWPSIQGRILSFKTGLIVKHGTVAWI